ncbi:hypothetical protein FTUN_3032 [Frigoriglobus tundricola]|uniref:Uncharacterized protein n=1 Tax=Frigoriglobus tundricola TaxID=2774151 RepID=A0A6M5YQB2_9BACT|nr:hypothetical protein FTUN_3032 [Frigoriglobus tundricola]
MNSYSTRGLTPRRSPDFSPHLIFPSVLSSINFADAVTALAWNGFSH